MAIEDKPDVTPIKEATTAYMSRSEMKKDRPTMTSERAPHRVAGGYGAHKVDGGYAWKNPMGSYLSKTLKADQVAAELDHWGLPKGAKTMSTPAPPTASSSSAVPPPKRAKIDDDGATLADRKRALAGRLKEKVDQLSKSSSQGLVHKGN